MTTCQICGRVIKANTGVIAHHGYERPGGGWQTSSCMGARYKPYEESCDRIPAVIESVELFIANSTNALKRMKSDPPSTLSYKRGNFRSKETIVEKPTNFDTSDDPSSYRPYTYESEYWREVHKLVSAIRSAKVDLTFLQERLTNWVSPMKEAA